MITLFRSKNYLIRLWNNWSFGYINNGYTKLLDLGFISIMKNKETKE